MRRALSTVLFVPFLVAGCGEDDESLSKEELIAEGEALCSDYEADTSELEEPQSVEELTALLETATRRTREFRTDMAALDPPAGEGEEVHEAFVEAIDETITKLEGSLEASREGDVEAVGARFDEASQAAMSVDEVLRAYGFDECANGDG